MELKTEDDTFRALSRISFIQLEKLYEEWWSKYKSGIQMATIEEVVNFFEPYHWTYNEFADIRSGRAHDRR